MKVMHISNVDLNLFRIAAALYQHRNVSKAAQELGLSQSAVSHALGRLRDQFGDPMFVRTSRGIAPTEFARSIQTELLEVVHQSERILTRKTAFDPKEAKGRITIATTDYFEIVIMPKLLKKLEREAPGVQVSIRPTVGELPKRELEEGKIDLAIAGFYEDLPEGFYRTKLFTDSFSSATSKEHSKFKTRLTTEDYYSAKHALITLQGDMRDPMAQGRAHGRIQGGKKALARDIVYGSYSFTGMAWVLSSSDLILTAPSLLLEQYGKFFPIRIWPCPVDIEPINIQMIWHMQTQEDPLRKWIREELRACLRV